LSVGADDFYFLLSLINFYEWRENQILIPDWTYFDCPATTRYNETMARRLNKDFLKIDEGHQKNVRSNQQSNLRGSYQSIFSRSWDYECSSIPNRKGERK